ncbi:MAG: hypothetical protein Q4G35_11750 [Propionibacteriaceae bacterium]|nr:hypothetical protein [Propionibacteriaceae bacterium]
MQHATLADVNSLVVPETCSVEGFDSPLVGKPLVDGELRGAENEMAKVVAEFAPVIFDFNGDGVDEALAVFYCDGGGVPWPDQLVLVAPGGQVLDAASTADALGQFKGRVSEFGALEGATVNAKIQGEELQYSAGVAVVDGKITVDVKDPLEGAVLSLSGYGPVRFGMPTSDLVALGYAVEDRDDECPATLPSETLKQHGIGFISPLDDQLWELWTTDPRVRTPSGAHVGMSEAALKAAYGDKLQRGELQYTYYVEIDERTMTFEVEQGEVRQIAVHDAPFVDVALPSGYC